MSWRVRSKNVNFIMLTARSLRYSCDLATLATQSVVKKKVDFVTKMCYFPCTGITLCFPCEICPLSLGRLRWARRGTGISTLEKCHNT